MKQFLSFVRKEFYHIFRDRRTMLILLGMPIVQIVLFGFAISTEVNNVRVAVLAPDRGEAVRRLVERIDANERFTVTGILDSPDQIDPAFQSGETDLVVVFGPEFGDNIYSADGARLQLIADATDPNTSTSVAMYASSIVNGYLADQLRASATVQGIVPDIKLLYNPQMQSAYNFVPGIMGLILMLICAMMTSISIVREKETGTMEVLLVSPVKPIYIILSKMVPYFVLSCVNFATILVLSVYLLDVPLAGSFPGLCGISLVFIVVSLALGLLISTVTATQVAAMLASGMVMLLPVLMLSGMLFPTESMPRLLQYVSLIIPARWYIEAVKKLMIEGLPAVYVTKEFIILCAMALFLIVVSLKKFKNRLE